MVKAAKKVEQKEKKPVEKSQPIKKAKKVARVAPLLKSEGVKEAPKAPITKKKPVEIVAEPPKAVLSKKQKKAAAAVEAAEKKTPEIPVAKVRPSINGKKVIVQKKKFSKTKKKDDESPASSSTEEEPVDTKIFESLVFNEDDFNAVVCGEKVEEIVTALNTTVKQELENKKNIFSDFRYMLNVANHKIPNCPKRMVKLKLKHALATQGEDDVVLIVKDIKRGNKNEYDDTIHHYEDLLRLKGIKGITILPFNKIRNEYTGFEMKRKLAAMYECYLCDGRIVGHVVGFLGKTFQKARTTLHSVRLNEHNDFAREITKSMHRTAFKQLAKGNLISIPVGTHVHSPKSVAENVILVVNQLKKIYPGGLPNVRNMYVKIDRPGTTALPIYIGMTQPPEETPNVIGPRELKMNKLKRQANAILSKFQFTQGGNITKLTPGQLERKRKIKAGKVEEATEEAVETKEAPEVKVEKPEEVEETEEVVVKAKKSKKEPKVDKEKKLKKKKAKVESKEESD